MKKILIRILIAIGGFVLIVVVNFLIFSITATRITEGVPITKQGNDQTALLIIDIQEGTTGVASATESYKNQSEHLITNTNLIIEDALALGWTIIYIISEVTNPLINLLNNTMAKGSEGAELDKRLNIQSKYIVPKRKNDPFTNVVLDEILTEHHTGKVVVVGLDAAHCVLSTVQAALNRGYRTSVIQEAVISKTDEEKNEAVNELKSLDVELINMDNL